MSTGGEMRGGEVNNNHYNIINPNDVGTCMEIDNSC